MNFFVADLTFMDKYVTGCTLFIALEMLLVTLSYVEPERDAEFKLIGDRCFVGLQAFFLCYAAYCRRFEMSKNEHENMERS